MIIEVSFQQTNIGLLQCDCDNPDEDWSISFSVTVITLMKTGVYPSV